MQLLKALRIRHYQSHRDTEIVFSKGVTGIIGKSNTGKTAILRALLWLKNYRPAGFAIHSNFTKQKSTSVSAVLEKNTAITLIKSKSGAVYELYQDHKSRKKPVTFKKFGGKVPDIIQEKLGLDEINIQNQIDPPFLITSPPGRIAEAINKATRKEQIDDWIKKINSKIYKRKTILGVLKEETEAKEKELKELEPLDDIGNDIIILKRLDKQIDRRARTLTELTGIMVGLKGARLDLRVAKQQLKVKKKVKQLEQLEDDILDLQREDDCIAAVEIKRRDIKTAVKAHRQLQARYIKRVEKTNMCPFCFGPLTDEVLARVKREIKLKGI